MNRSKMFFVMKIVRISNLNYCVATACSLSRNMYCIYIYNIYNNIIYIYNNMYCIYIYVATIYIYMTRLISIAESSSKI